VRSAAAQIRSSAPRTNSATRRPLAAVARRQRRRPTTFPPHRSPIAPPIPAGRRIGRHRLGIVADVSWPSASTQMKSSARAAAAESAHASTTHTRNDGVRLKRLRSPAARCGSSGSSSSRRRAGSLRAIRAAPRRRVRAPSRRAPREQRGRADLLIRQRSKQFASPGPRGRGSARAPGVTSRNRDAGAAGEQHCLHVVAHHCNVDGGANRVDLVGHDAAVDDAMTGAREQRDDQRATAVVGERAGVRDRDHHGAEPLRRVVAVTGDARRLAHG
jgi:hypothetical protein